jgi:hypothetical protein
LGEIKAKRRKRLYGLVAIIFVLCISLSALASFELNAKSSLSVQKIDALTKTTPEPSAIPMTTPSPMSNQMPVDFTCSVGSSDSFTVTVAVDLEDGMNKTEALAVADAIFNHEVTNAEHIIKSVEVNDANVWIVNLSWGMIYADGEKESLTHFFDITINSQNQTATYTRCF